MSNELALASNQPAGAMSVFDRVDPMEFIDKMGKVIAYAGICKDENEGKVLALKSLSSRQDIFEIKARYHLIGGNLTIKPEVMLADLRRAGGKFQWVKTGEDGEAIIHLEFEGGTVDSKYSMSDAEKAGLVKPNSGWQKNPANMLRARAVSNGIRMIAPEISAGMYTPEEAQDFESHAPQPKRSAEEVANRAEELRQMNQQAQQVQSQQSEQLQTTEEPVEDVEFDTKEMDAQRSDSMQDDITAIRLDVDALIKEIGMTQEQFEAACRKSNPEFTSLDALNAKQLSQLHDNLQAKVSQAVRASKRES